jgi:hypothetical protein
MNSVEFMTEENLIQALSLSNLKTSGFEEMDRRIPGNDFYKSIYDTLVISKALYIILANLYSSSMTGH